MWADYVIRTIYRREVRIAQQFPSSVGKTHKACPSRHLQFYESAIGDHLLSSNICGERYLDKRSVVHKAGIKHHLNILKAV